MQTRGDRRQTVNRVASAGVHRWTSHPIRIPEGDAAADSEQKSEPAAIDEIAASAPSPDEETVTPLDPRLRTRAEGELQEVSHDLPLTVNDEVLAFVNYFQTTRGRAIVETGLRRAGRFRPMIEDVLREQGMPTDLMYLAQAESAFSAASAFESGRARAVAVHGLPRQAVRPGARLVGG